MAYAPIALTIPQYDSVTFALWWLKAYVAGTTTPLSMATDSTGGTLLAKCQIDAEGFPIAALSARFIPFIDGDYDLWCFPTVFDANNNITTDAKQFANNINADPENGIPYNTLVTLTGAETLTNKTLTAPIENSPVLNGTLSGTAFLDDDTMAADSAIATVSQQSLRAYIAAEIATAVAALDTQIGGLNTLVLDLGDWDMDATVSIGIPHGLTYSKIRSATVYIRDDADTVYYDINYDDGSGTGASGIAVNNPNIAIWRETSGFFDSTNFNATTYNRGWAVIKYTD